MANRTQGEWYTGVGAHGHFPIYVMKGSSKLIGLTMNDGLDTDNSFESAANAHYMAAAPKMYDALYEVVHNDGVEMPAWIMDLVEGALAKAQGDA